MIESRLLRQIIMQSIGYIPRQFLSEEVLLSVNGWLFWNLNFICRLIRLKVCHKKDGNKIDNLTIEKINSEYFSFEKFCFFLIFKKNASDLKFWLHYYFSIFILVFNILVFFYDTKMCCYYDLNNIVCFMYKDWYNGVVQTIVILLLLFIHNPIVYNASNGRWTASKPGRSYTTMRLPFVTYHQYIKLSQYKA